MARSSTTKKAESTATTTPATPNPSTDAPISKPYTSAMVGSTTKGPYAFHVEGYISRDPSYHPVTADKVAYVHCSMGISGNAFQLMAIAEGTYEKDTEYPENEFINLSVIGQAAESFSNTVEKGFKVAISGKLQKKSYEDKNTGEPRESVEILVNAFSVLASKKSSGKISHGMGAATQVRTKNGEEIATPLACCLTGKIVNVKPLATNGSLEYLQFNMTIGMAAEKALEISNGTYNKEKVYNSKATFVNCTVFGQRAVSLAKILAVDMIVCCTGKMNENIYNEKIYIQMIPAVLSVAKWADDNEQSVETKPSVVQAPTPQTNPTSYPQIDSAEFDGLDDEDDDDLPF